MSDPASQQRPAPSETIWRVLLWCVVALAVALHLAQFANLQSFFQNYAELPVKLKPVDERGPIRYRVEAIAESALPAALGVQVGDILRPPAPTPSEGRYGQAAEFTLVSGGAERKVTIPYLRKDLPADVLVHDIAWPVVQCLQLALGVILLRNRTAGTPALALAAPLIFMGVPDLLDVVLPLPMNAFVPWMVSILMSLYPLGVPLFTVFAYEFTRPQLSINERRYAQPVAWLLPIVAAALFSLGWPSLTGWYEPLANGLYALSWVLVWCYVVGVLMTGLRRSTGDLRERYASIALSAGYLLAVYVIWNIYAWWLGHWTYIGGVIATLFIFAGVVALTVSLLRRHVVELRVAVSRTLVFSIVSAVLVLAFGLAEFASDKLLHFEGRESNILLDTAVALLLFVTARRLHHGVERFVEKTLFRPWHLALNELRDFARDAGFITNADVLRGRLLQALARFAGTPSPARLFHRSDTGDFIEWKSDGGRAHAFDENAPWLVTLRATLAPLQRSPTHPDMPDALAAPILRTGHLTGFVLLGPKSNEQTYRSDELAAIQEVLGKVTLDLECLRAIEAEAQLRLMAQGTAVTHSDLERPAPRLVIQGP